MFSQPIYAPEAIRFDSGVNNDVYSAKLGLGEPSLGLCYIISTKNGSASRILASPAEWSIW